MGQVYCVGLSHEDVGYSSVQFVFVADGFDHWTVTMDGGDGFEVEPDNCPGSESVSTIGISGALPLDSVIQISYDSIH